MAFSTLNPTIRAREKRLAPAMWTPMLIGLAGSIGILLGSFGVGWLGHDSVLRTWPLLAELRGSAVATELCAATLVGGGVLLLAAWLQLRSLAAASHPDALRSILVTAAVWAAPLLVTVPVFSRDLFAYVGQGRLMASGLNPYTDGIAAISGWFALGVDPLWSDSPTPYGPLYLLIEGAAVQLGGWDTSEVSIALLRVVSVVGVVASGYYLLRLARLRGLDLSLTAWVVIANPLTLLLFVAAGHNDAVMIAFILAALLYASTGGRVRAVVLIAAAIAIKPIAVLAVPVLALFWLRGDAPLRERMRLWLITGGAAIALVGALGVAAGVGLGWVVAMVVPGAIAHWYAPMAWITSMVGSGITLTGHDPALAVSAVKLLALLAAAATVVVVMSSRRAIDPLLRLTLAFLAVICASTAIHPWYVMWVFPIAALAVPWRREHVHLAVYATLFFGFVTLGEPVDGGGGALDTVPARVLTVAAVAVLGLYFLIGYSRDERVDGRVLLDSMAAGRRLRIARRFPTL
ncbi:polyprenol phosphomannose-dependent alpha 1,6 mannosyltransferase MptB [Microbacteriaceae bacterium VKM Ac-2854]|nr:polyprenol phosphomannose-dependent alpha 1,6 mannosyltransferase MptB [Microbacteriaceae bacterium VKM Ac-2854]